MEYGVWSMVGQWIRSVLRVTMEAKAWGVERCRVVTLLRMKRGGTAVALN